MLAKLVKICNKLPVKLLEECVAFQDPHWEMRRGVHVEKSWMKLLDMLNGNNVILILIGKSRKLLQRGLSKHLVHLLHSK